MYVRFLISIVLLFSLPTLATAAESSSSIEVKPVYPANQVPATKGYFDVDVKPEEQLMIHLRLKNNENHPITVRAEKTNAYTSPTGGIIYETTIDSENTILLDDADLMTEYIEVEQTVTIPANESFDLPIQITVPQNDGKTLLGGIKVTQVADEKEIEEEKLGKDEAKFVMNTEITYAIAIKLNLPSKSEPNFLLGKAGFIPKTAQVYLELTNDAQLIQGKISGTYAVLDSDGSELFKGVMNTFIMAPKSKIRFPFAWNHETLEDGDYTLEVDGHAGEKQFSVKEPFTISSEEVQEYAKTVNPTVEIEDKPIVPIWVWIVGMIVFGFIMFLVGRRKK